MTARAEGRRHDRAPRHPAFDEPQGRGMEQIQVRAFARAGTQCFRGKLCRDLGAHFVTAHANRRSENDSNRCGIRKSRKALLKNVGRQPTPPRVYECDAVRVGEDGRHAIGRPYGKDHVRRARARPIRGRDRSWIGHVHDVVPMHLSQANHGAVLQKLRSGSCAPDETEIGHSGKLGIQMKQGPIGTFNPLPSHAGRA